MEIGRAYWKSLRLGDAMSHPEDRTLDLLSVQENRPPFAATAKIIEAPAAALHRVTVPFFFIREGIDAEYSGETYRNFEIRTVEFLTALNTEAAYNPTIGTFSGPLCFVMNPDEDIHEIASITYTGSLDTIETAASHNINAGEWVLLRRDVGAGLNPRFELVQVYDIPSSTEIRVALTATNWGTEAELIRCWYAYENAFVDGPFLIPGQGSDAYRAKLDLSLNFKSMGDPVTLSTVYV